MLGGMIAYFRSSIEELKRVSWPSRAKTTRLTVYVIIISVAVAAYLGLLDYIFLRVTEIFIKR